MVHETLFTYAPSIFDGHEHCESYHFTSKSSVMLHRKVYVHAISVRK